MTTNTKSQHQITGKLLYGDLSYKLNGVLFAVHNELGRFVREKQYSDLVEEKLKEKGIAYKRELIIGDSGNIIDFLIEDKIIFELKSKPYILNTDYDQVKRYLQSSDLKLGMIVNFRSKYLQPKRIICRHP